MTAEFLRDFFPVAAELLESHTRFSLINVLFPPHIEKLCPTPSFFLKGIGELRWPTVALTSAAGAFVGTTAGLHTLRLAKSQRTRTFGMGFLWYALMCVGALLHHSLVAPSHTHMARKSGLEALSYAMDVVGTGCAGISVALACTLEGRALSMALVFCYAVAVFVGACGPQIAREALYLVPTCAAVLAAGAFLWNLVRDERRLAGQLRRQRGVRFWVACGCAGAVVALVGLVGDRWLCVGLGSNFGLLFFFFVGCHLSFFSLWPLALIQDRISRSPSLKAQ